MDTNESLANLKLVVHKKNKHNQSFTQIGTAIEYDADVWKIVQLLLDQSFLVICNECMRRDECSMSAALIPPSVVAGADLLWPAICLLATDW